MDSFSEPSVGLAVLKQEAEQLMLESTQNRGLLEASQMVSSQTKRASGVEASALESLAKLHSDVRDLGLDLNWKLMALYSQNDWCDEFLDCYLRSVQQAAESPAGLAVWTFYALDCARKCGRADEVADALRHIIRFQSRRGSVEGIRTALEEWEAQQTRELVGGMQ